MRIYKLWRHGWAISFSSLFIGMSLAILAALLVNGPSTMTFSSLFIGMSLAIDVAAVGLGAFVVLSVPFSSG